MKTKKYYLALTVLTAILYIPALGDIQLIQSDKTRVNPALAGIEELYVFTVQPDAEPNKDGLVWEELDGKVELKLKEAGIKIAQVTYLGGRVVMDHNIPQLRVYIDMLKPSDSQQYVLHIRTSLVSSISLVKQPGRYIKADIWKAESAMQAASVQNMPAKVTEVVLEQVEVFIQAYHTANPPGVRSADVKTSETVSPITPKKPSELPDRQIVAEYKYVASKNSEVFHRPGCRWAEKISPRNLVVYNSTDEATKAGKRPCKLCKP